MIWFKACPKCRRGDIVLQRDFHGSYLSCMQCGFTKDLGEQASQPASAPAAEPAVAAVAAAAA